MEPRRVRKRSSIVLIAGVLLIVSCETTKNKDFLGSAVVETQTYQIATTSQGVVSVLKEEGMPAKANELVAIIDTIPLNLKLAEINASKEQLAKAIAAKKAELELQANEKKGSLREFQRISDLVGKGALPSQQKDNLETQTEGVKIRFSAVQFSLENLMAQMKILDVQRANILNQIEHCYVRAPIDGIILTRYKNDQEVYMPGNPVYEIGRYDTMRVDFYVTQPMLPNLKLGQSVRVRIDTSSNGKKGTGCFLPASISWISNDAEFSPKNIQTRESRNELVFRIRAFVPNLNGILKRGLPIEVWTGSAN